MTELLDKKEIISNLEQLDIWVEEFDEPGKEQKYILTVIGGASFLLKEITLRKQTTDIDTFISKEEMPSLLNSFENLFGDDAAIKIRDRLSINSDVYFFKLREIISKVEDEETYKEIKISKNILNLIIRIPRMEVLVLTKLIVSMENDPDRNDRDFIDISSGKILENFDFETFYSIVDIWKSDFAKSWEISKFQGELKRWEEHHNIKYTPRI